MGAGRANTAFAVTALAILAILTFANKPRSENVIKERVSAQMLKHAVLYFPYFKSIRQFDPHHVTNASEACLSENLYSRLVTLSDDGQISGDLADDIAWDGTSYRLHIRNGVATTDGHLITPSDVVASIKRNFKLDQNTHGNLRMLMNESGIRSDGENIFLTPKDERLKTFLITLLASSDFAIIPSIAIDYSKPNLPVIDWRNSSGIYYVDEDSETGAYTLKVNKNHHFYNGRQVETLKLYPGLGYDAVDLFNKGIVDIIPTITVADTADFADVDLSQANIHRTENIYLTTLSFTPRGLSKFPIAERLKIGHTIRNALLRAQKPGPQIPTVEFLPRFGEGSLSTEQQVEVQSHSAKSIASMESMHATLGVYPSKLEYFRKALAQFPEISVQPTKGRPAFLEPLDSQPDIYFAMGDSSFFESLSLLYYYFDRGTFLDRETGMKWLERYIWTPDKRDRLELLKDLHFQALTSGRVIPVSVGPYIAVARKPLTPHFSKFYAGSPLWKLTID